ncbi:ATP-binding cassette domain-containing protein [Lacticaseibacillus mingshuiensis]|uniref:ATP-binding cassette domain-containing protein n=1 Tax=Lacticaseibacillus mingshuiensis TaxID=2799574 RepID=A0ABW4CJG2_9LACO|nr:ABC transporter ATP-binding protein [Lacticaseibacillus mingshuiensis]
MTELKVTNVAKHFGRKNVLSGINVTFTDGQIYGLLGRNGVGKSTLLRLLNNRLLADRGQITLDGASVVDNEAAQNRIFLMSAEMLYPAEQKVSWVFKITKQLYGDFDDALAAHLVSVFHVDTTSRLSRLSTGYKTLVKLIVALCVPCDFVLLDEPVLGLDAPNRQLFYQELMATFTDRPRTFIIATHLIEEISQLVNRVVVIERGVVTLDQDADELRQRGKMVTGPAATVRDWLADVKVLRTNALGGVLAAYTLDAPLEKPLPAGVTMEAMNLQQLFIELTRKEDGAHAR